MAIVHTMKNATENRPCLYYQVWVQEPTLQYYICNHHYCLIIRGGIFLIKYKHMNLFVNKFTKKKPNSRNHRLEYSHFRIIVVNSFGITFVKVCMDFRFQVVILHCRIFFHVFNPLVQSWKLTFRNFSDKKCSAQSFAFSKFTSANILQITKFELSECNTK